MTTETHLSVEKIRAIIVEDEPKTRSAMETMLKEFCPFSEWVGSARDLPEAIKLIHKHKPDVIFLDIELPGYSGLQLLDFFEKEEISFSIIFTTAYSEYALQAFQLSAVDYLLKPVQIEQLNVAIEKVRRHKTSPQSYQRIQALKNNFEPEPQSLKIALPMTEGWIILNSSDIIYLKAEGAYTRFITKNSSSILASKNLKEFDRLLDLKYFFRPHRSYVINLNFVNQIIRKDGGYILMDNGDQVMLTQAKRDELLVAIQEL